MCMLKGFLFFEYVNFMLLSFFYFILVANLLNEFLKK